LSEEIDVGNKSSLQNNWNIGSVEKLNWVWLSEPSHFSTAETQFNSESLEVNDNKDNNDCTE